MSDVQLYLIEIDKDKAEATRIAAGTAQRLQSQQLKLLGLIESLGEFLNNDDGAIRSKTMSYLAEVLQAMPTKVLTGQQRNLLVEFVLSRITDDSEGVGSGAKALVALEGLGQWDADKARKVMTTLLNSTHPLIQNKLQSERYPVLLLIDLLLSKYRNAIHSLHNEEQDFLPRFVAYFDGEKDPRNLMIIFSIFRVVGTEWDVSACAQELFEASFNYFPITFRPPPDDPYGITAQDLKNRLKLCISANASFSPFSFPALLDKLDSTSMNVKRDVLQAMFSCVQEYGPATVNLYSVTLWDALKFEVLSVQEEDLAEESLKVLAEIGRQLSKASHDALTAYLKPVAKECNEHLEDAPTKQSQGATRMMHAIASSSAPACSFLVSAILPHLFQLYQGTKDVAKRRGLVETLTQLIKADIAVFGEWRRNFDSSNGVENLALGDVSANALANFTSKALETLNAALAAASISQVSYRLVLLDALLQLAKVRALLLDEQISQIISLFDSIVISEESYGLDEVKSAAITGLVEIAHQKSQLIIDKSFPEFLAQLPDNNESGPEQYVPVLEAFAKLGGEEKVFDIVALRLKNKFSAAVQNKASPTYVQAILKALLYAFSQEEQISSSNPTFSKAFQDLVQPLIQKICLEADEELQGDDTFYLTGRLANVVLRKKESQQQTPVVQEAYTLFLGSSAGSDSFAKDSPMPTKRRLILSTQILAAARKDVPLPSAPSEALPNLIQVLAEQNLTPGVRVGCLQQMSIILNKFVPTAQLKATTDPLLYEPTKLLEASSLNATSIPITFAILKALILRNAPGLAQIFSALTSLLTDPTHGTAIAHGFAMLLQPDEILTKENHCSISPLHKQKTFATLVPDITNGFRSADGPSKKNYLIALSGIVRSLPYAILESQLSTLSPLLLQTLDIEGEDAIKAGTIDTLTTILVENPKIIEEHTGSLITRLLNCGSGKTNPASVRAAAMKCLAMVVTQLRTELVIPYRKQVIKRLTAPLDDRKRAVRLEAVKCRAKWIEMDEVGDDDE